MNDLLLKTLPSVATVVLTFDPGFVSGIGQSPQRYTIYALENWWNILLGGKQH